MIYKSVGRAGGNGQDFEFPKGIKMPCYKIIVDDSVVELPKLIYDFWEHFHNGLDVDDARQSFVEGNLKAMLEMVGYKEEIILTKDFTPQIEMFKETFDEYLKILLEEGVIVSI